MLGGYKSRVVWGGRDREREKGTERGGRGGGGGRQTAAFSEKELYREKGEWLSVGGGAWEWAELVP